MSDLHALRKDLEKAKLDLERRVAVLRAAALDEVIATMEEFNLKVGEVAIALERSRRLAAAQDGSRNVIELAGGRQRPKTTKK